MAPQRIRDALQTVVSSSLADAGNVVIAPEGQPRAGMRTGFHCHDGWELFAPLGDQLRFEVAGGRAMTIAAGGVLLVRPGCLHLAIHLLPQRPRLRTLMISFPQRAWRSGGVWLDQLDRVLSRSELASWTALVRDAPGAVVERVAASIQGDGFAGERALSDLRLLLSALGEIAFAHETSEPAAGDDAVARAEALLHREYYRADLDLAQIAEQIGLSPSHLSRLFKARTGLSVHQSLIRLRLRRARELLRDATLSIKEVAALTGWSDQLYFSSAFRRGFGMPPSRLRRRAEG
jgi:AraC-like DNA-binding protein